jgi:hypothetical protein
VRRSVETIDFRAKTILFGSGRFLSITNFYKFEYKSE